MSGKSPWTDESHAALITLWNDGLSISNIDRRLSVQFSQDWTRNAVIGMLQRLAAKGARPLGVEIKRPVISRGTNLAENRFACPTTLYTDRQLLDFLAADRANTLPLLCRRLKVPLDEVQRALNVIKDDLAESEKA